MRREESVFRRGMQVLKLRGFPQKVRMNFSGVPAAAERTVPTVNPPCPWLPEVSEIHDFTITRRHGRERGAEFYQDALCYAQSQWISGKPAQAILQLDKAWMADLACGDPVLVSHPPPIRRWFGCSSGRLSGNCGYLGNPVRHFQHLASRMSGPRADIRAWRAWLCFHLARARPAARGICAGWPPTRPRGACGFRRSGAACVRWRPAVGRERRSAARRQSDALGSYPGKIRSENFRQLFRTRGVSHPLIVLIYEKPLDFPRRHFVHWCPWRLLFRQKHQPCRKPEISRRPGPENPLLQPRGSRPVGERQALQPSFQSLGNLAHARQFQPHPGAHGFLCRPHAGPIRRRGGQTRKPADE